MLFIHRPERTSRLLLTLGLIACTPDPPPTAGTATVNPSIAAATVAAPTAASATPKGGRQLAPQRSVLPPLVNLGRVPTPADNALTMGRVALGRQLFFDRRLSGRATTSCATCHDPAQGWSDGKRRSTKPSGELNRRHTTTLFNVGYQTSFGWDGRHTRLEAMVAEQWRDQLEADRPARAAVIAAVDGYRRAFEEHYGGPPTADRIDKALAAFVRSIRTGNAPFDRWERGETGAIDDSAERGWKLFRTIGCSSCHAPPHFTDHSFHNAGVGHGDTPDPGRRRVTGASRDTGKMKTPTLRSVTRHPPYLHDGHAAALVDAVSFMAGGGRDNPHKDDGLTRVEIDEGEKRDLLAFLASLDGAPPEFVAPRLP